jgi:hypothetical protein
MKKILYIFLAALLFPGCSGQALERGIHGSIAGMEGREHRVFTKTGVQYPGIGNKFTIDLVTAELSAGPDWGDITSVEVTLEYVSLSGNILFGDDAGHPYADPTRATFTFTMPLFAGDVDRTQVVVQRGVGGYCGCIYLMPNTGPGLYDIIMTARHGSESVRLTYYAFQIQ